MLCGEWPRPSLRPNQLHADWGTGDRVCYSMEYDYVQRPSHPSGIARVAGARSHQGDYPATLRVTCRTNLTPCCCICVCAFGAVHYVSLSVFVCFEQLCIIYMHLAQVLEHLKLFCCCPENKLHFTAFSNYFQVSCDMSHSQSPLTSMPPVPADPDDIRSHEPLEAFTLSPSVITPSITRAGSQPNVGTSTTLAGDLRHGSSEQVQRTVDHLVDNAMFSSTAASHLQRPISMVRGRQQTERQQQEAERQLPEVRSSMFGGRLFDMEKCMIIMEKGRDI